MNNSNRQYLLWITSIIGIFGLIWIFRHPVAAQSPPPLPPAVYYGTILPSSAFTPVAGMVLEAYIGSNQCGETETTQQDGNIHFVILIAADATQSGCGILGRRIQFRVADHDLLPMVEWDNHQPHEVALYSAAAEPVAVPVSISTIATNIELTWTTNIVNQAYEVHRSLSPFFTPTADTLIAALPGDANSFIDVGVAGDPTASYFYTVLSVNGTTHVSANQVGAISYVLNNTGNKHSLIALPFLPQGITDAASLANYIGNVDGLLKWNPGTGTFRFFTPPNSGDNFSLLQGDALFVVVNSGGPNVVTFAGNVAQQQYLLYPDNFNFISLPLQEGELVDAAAVGDDIVTAQTLLSWNSSTQLFRFFAPPNGGDKFVVRPGTPFIVRISPGEPIPWPLLE